MNINRFVSFMEDLLDELNYSGKSFTGQKHYPKGADSVLDRMDQVKDARLNRSAEWQSALTKEKRENPHYSDIPKVQKKIDNWNKGIRTASNVRRLVAKDQSKTHAATDPHLNISSNPSGSTPQTKSQTSEIKKTLGDLVKTHNASPTKKGEFLTGKGPEGASLKIGRNNKILDFVAKPIPPKETSIKEPKNKAPISAPLSAGMSMQMTQKSEEPSKQAIKAPKPGKTKLSADDIELIDTPEPKKAPESNLDSLRKNQEKQLAAIKNSVKSRATKVKDPYDPENFNLDDDSGLY